MDKSTNSLGSKILSGLVLAYFIFLVGGLYFCSQIQPTLCVSVFGTLLIFICVCCITGAVKESFKVVNLVVGVLFGFAGICMTVVPLLLQYAPNFQQVDGERLAITIVILFVNAIGLSILVTVIGSLIQKRMRCTMPVNAVTVDRILNRALSGVEQNRWHRSRRFRYGFSFSYRGTEYLVEETLGTNMDRLSEGEKVELYINPDNPNQFYRRRPMTNFVLILLGASWLIIGIICLIAYVF